MIYRIAGGLFGLFLLLMVFSIHGFPRANASSIGETLTPPIVALPNSDQHRYVIETNQQVVISAAVRNPHSGQEPQPVTLLVEVRDEHGITIFLSYQSTKLEPLQDYQAGFSWSTDKPEEYLIRTFAISDLNNPMILSSIRASPIIVTDDKVLLSNAEKITLFGEIPIPDFYEQSDMNYTVRAIANQHQSLCGQKYFDFNSNLRSMRQDDPYFPYWFPQRVQFQYLQSYETFYRQPCTETYSGVTQTEVYADYVIRGNVTIPVDSLDVAELFHIMTINEALEYLAYFAYNGTYFSYNTAGSGIIASVDTYYATKEYCALEVDSPVRFIRVTVQDDNSFMIELNISNAGSIEYHKWRFEPDSKPVLVSSKILGHCTGSE